MGDYFLNSVFVTAMCILGSVLIDSMVGYGLARYDNKLIKMMEGEDYNKETLFDHIPIDKDNLEEKYTYLYGGKLSDYINAE